MARKHNPTKHTSDKKTRLKIASSLSFVKMKEITLARQNKFGEDSFALANV